MNTIETCYRVGDSYFSTLETAQAHVAKLERKQALAEYIHDAANIPETYAEDVAELLLARFETIKTLTEKTA